VSFDVIIAGGGVMGSACAYFLHTHANFRGTVAVVEPDPTYRQAATALSASSIRQQFSTPVNIALSAFGMDFLRRARPRLSTAGFAGIQLSVSRDVRWTGGARSTLCDPALRGRAGESA
jgi:glycine/D-amino acid oxidase-like deaminating enzyme